MPGCVPRRRTWQGGPAGEYPHRECGNQVARAIDALRPPLVLLENVRGLLSAGADSNLEPCWCMGDEREQPVLRALGAVLGDLADIGFETAEWAVVSAADAGAPHRRERVFVLAWPSVALGVASDAEGDDGSKGGPNQVNGRGSRDSLQGVVSQIPCPSNLLPTPAARD